MALSWERSQKNFPFCISSSPHLESFLNRKILELPQVVLRFFSIGTIQSEINLSAKHRSVSFPFPGKQTYVFTRRDLTSERTDITFISKDSADGLQSIHAEKIWLVGGAQLTASLLRLKLIDEYIISIVPIMLGEGIALFTAPVPEQTLILLEAKTYQNGLLQLHYKRAN